MIQQGVKFMELPHLEEKYEMKMVTVTEGGNEYSVGLEFLSFQTHNLKRPNFILSTLTYLPDYHDETMDQNYGGMHRFPDTFQVGDVVLVSGFRRESVRVSLGQKGSLRPSLA